LAAIGLAVALAGALVGGLVTVRPAAAADEGVGDAVAALTFEDVSDAVWAICAKATGEPERSHAVSALDTMAAAESGV
jgi:hypothetical protein